MRKILMGLILILLPYFLFSKTISVNNGHDSGAGSFREAVSKAKSGDTITFDCGVYEVKLTSGTIDIFNKSLYIKGCKSTIMRDKNSQNYFRLIRISAVNSINVCFEEVNFAYGHSKPSEDPMFASESGGAILINDANVNLELRNANIYNNTTAEGLEEGDAGSGGSIYVLKGKLIINNCNFYNNTTGNGKMYDGLCEYGSNGGNGGAIGVYYGKLDIRNTVFYNNNTGNGKASNGVNGSAKGGDGGAVWLSNSEAIIINTTFYQNFTGNGDKADCGFGGAIAAVENSIIDIYNATITKNLSGANTSNTDTYGGGVFVEFNTELNLYNTIIAENYLFNENIKSGIDIYGTFNSYGGNLIGICDDNKIILDRKQSDILGTLTSPVDAKLLPLSDNGGLTLTCPLKTESPAIDAAKYYDLSSNDQRNYPRTELPDIGAFEYAVSPNVLKVFAENKNTNYNTGEEIIISIEFNEKVYVIGSPKLMLATNLNQVGYADYISGSNTNILKFKYKIKDTDFTQTLNYVDLFSLIAESGTYLLDFDNQKAVLLLPEVDSDNSLGASSNISLNNISNNIIETNNIKVFPNPTKNIIIIQSDKEYNLELKNIQGVRLYSEKNITSAEYQLDLTNYATGIYIIKIEDNLSTNIQKIVKH